MEMISLNHLLFWYCISFILNIYFYLILCTTYMDILDFW